MLGPPRTTDAPVGLPILVWWHQPGYTIGSEADLLSKVDRRQFLMVPALAAATELHGQSASRCLLRAGLVAYSFRKQLEARTMNYEALIRLVSELGLDGLDVTAYWFPDTSDQFLVSLRRAAYKNAVNLYSVAAGVNLCQPTPERQQAAVENAKKWIDISQKVGATHLRVFGGAVPKGATEAQAMAWAVEVLKRAAEYAGSKGVLLGIEDDGGLTSTAEPTVELVKQADSPWVGINLDVGNFPKNGYAQVALCIPYAVNVHFKNRIAGEDGTPEKADWDRLLGMFAQAGYKGYLSLEYEDTAAAETAVPLLAAELRRGVRTYSA
jgi:sugar phosphate isomerase/epimerase